MPGDTLRHWKAPLFGYFRLAKEVHAAEVRQMRNGFKG